MTSVNDRVVVSTDLPLSYVLLHAARAMEARVESALSQYGLSMAKLGILRHLVLEGAPLTLTRLAELNSCVKSNITQLVDRLEADKLVERIGDPDDRRSVRAAITEAGIDACANGNAEVGAVERELVSFLGRPEYERLREALFRLKS